MVRALAFDNVITVRNDLKQAGFIVNEDKICLVAYKAFNMLGFELNSVINRIQVDEDKINNILCCINNVLSCYVISAKQLASIVGKITALHIALGDIVYFKTKHCQIDISNRHTWNKKAPINNICVMELRFWIQNLRFLKNTALENVKFKHDLTVYTDAGAHKCGGYIENCTGTDFVHCWTVEKENYIR